MSKLGLVFSWDFEDLDRQHTNIQELVYIRKILKAVGVNEIIEYVNDNKTQYFIENTLNELSDGYSLIVIFISTHGDCDKNDKFQIYVHKDKKSKNFTPANFDEVFIEPLKNLKNTKVWINIQACQGSRLSTPISTWDYEYSGKKFFEHLECNTKVKSQEPQKITVKGLPKNVFLFQTCTTYSAGRHSEFGSWLFYNLYRSIEEQCYGRNVDLEKLAFMANQYMSREPIYISNPEQDSVLDTNPTALQLDFNENRLQSEFISTLLEKITFDISKIQLNISLKKDPQNAHHSLGYILKPNATEQKHKKIGFFVQMEETTNMGFIGSSRDFRTRQGTSVYEFDHCRIEINSTENLSLKFTIKRSLHSHVMSGFEYIEFDEISTYQLQEFNIAPLELSTETLELDQEIQILTPTTVFGMIKELGNKEHFNYVTNVTRLERGMPILNENGKVIGIHNADENYKPIALGVKNIKLKIEKVLRF